MNPYIFPMAFMWLFLYENRGIDPLYFLIINFAVMFTILLVSMLFGHRESIELEDNKLIISQRKVNYSVALETINSIKLLKLDREIVIKTHDTEYRYKAYHLGKKKIERFFEANKIPIKIDM